LNGPDPFVPRAPPAPCQRVAPDPTRTTPKWETTFDRQRYTRSEILDGNGKFTLHWTVEDKEVHFAAEVDTKGWFGFGIGSAGGMAGADIVLGWLDSVNKQVFIHDRMADAEARPSVDALQDFYDIRGVEIFTDSKKSLLIPIVVGSAGLLVFVVGVVLCMNHRKKKAFKVGLLSNSETSQSYA
jgi:hypothetical protein